MNVWSGAEHLALHDAHLGGALVSLRDDLDPLGVLHVLHLRWDANMSRHVGGSI